MKNKKDDHITLKEAAEITGYAPDYIGQLIRKGKIEGKQVFSNVSWVTTAEAIRSYMEGDAAKKGVKSDTAAVSLEDMERAYSYIGKVLIALLCIFALLLVYVLSVSIDNRIQMTLVEKAQNNE